MATLADTPIHNVMKVTEIGGARTFRRRLLEMGVVPGSRICVTNVAPMGCPIEFEARNTRLSIRRVEATNILVETISK